MAKYRIVQVKPEGIPYSFIIEKAIKVLMDVNPKYRGNQVYWESSFKYNAAGRPADWFTKVDREEWNEVCSCNTLARAEWLVKDLQEKGDFKPVIVKEYE